MEDSKVSSPDEGRRECMEKESTEPPAVIMIVLQFLKDTTIAKKDSQQNAEQDEMIYEEVEMTSAWRVVSFFIVIFVLPTILISVPLYARYHLYRAQTLSSTDGDMLSLHSGVSSFWCQGQRVTSNGTFEAYLTSKPRRLKKRHRMSFLSSELLLAQDDIEEWGVHLIRGSRFSFSSCSRWPGGTLLVVQGEENMRKCFYREERVKQLLTEPHNNKPLVQPSEVVTKQLITEANDEILGEVFDETGNEISAKDEILQRLYSPKYANLSDIIVPQQEVDLNQQKDRKAFNTKKDILNKARREKQLQEAALNESLSSKVNKKFNLPQQANEEFLAVHKGSFFFDPNDTLDVTAGNSSFSSSEEFMQQCTNTISSIELTPYTNCRDIASVNNTDGPNYWSFAVNKTDFYYFIFTSDNSIEANVISFRLLIERILYNISDPIEMCTSDSECQFSFPFLKSAGVIVDFSTYANASKLEELKSYELTSVCQPRTVVYTIFILMVPFIIILFAFR